MNFGACGSHKHDKIALLQLLAVHLQLSSAFNEKVKTRCNAQDDHHDDLPHSALFLVTLETFPTVAACCVTLVKNELKQLTLGHNLGDHLAGGECC